MATPIQVALEHHHAGRLQEAEQHYRILLQSQPNQPDANHNLGVLLIQDGRHEEGLPLLSTALESNPSEGQYWLSFAEALLASGQISEASMVIQTAIQSGLDTPATNDLLQQIIATQSRLAESAPSGQTAHAKVSAPVKSQPTRKSKSPIRPAEINQLVALFNAGNYVEMESLARLLIKRHPNYGFAWKALGTSLQGQHRDSTPALQKAALLLPNDIEVHNNLGIALEATGEFDAAIASCQRAVKINPKYAEAYNTLGNILNSLGQLDDATASYRQALAINPDYAVVHRNLGIALKNLGQLDGAMTHFHRALELEPDYAEAYSNLGSALKDIGRLDDAIACFRRALELKPDYPDAHSNLLFAMDLSPLADMAGLLRERQEWDAAHAAPLWQEPRHSNSPDPDRRLRIGYISADFREHSAPRAFGGMLTRYDRAQFDIFAYSNFKGKADKFTDLFRQSVTGWRSIIGLSDDTVAEMIREDEIDILVDLSGHSAGNRLLVFARKPAPVQITAWGYATGTGMRAMDVFFTDQVMVPAQEKQYFAEEIRYLPSVVGSFFTEPFPDVNELPALRDGVVTFGSFNRLAKVSAEAYRAWAEVLLAVPGSRLLLKTAELEDASIREQITGHFTKAGVRAERVIMQGRTSWYEHMQTFNQVDLALDPFPHGGGLTTLEGLMMGIPVLTLRWPTTAGRLSASIVTTMGLPDWIAATQEEYVELAIRKAANLQSLAALRQQLRGIFTSSVIGDQAAYAQAVELEYRQLWREWCASSLTKAARQA